MNIFGIVLFIIGAGTLILTVLFALILEIIGAIRSKDILPAIVITAILFTFVGLIITATTDKPFTGGGSHTLHHRRHLQ